MREVRSVSSFPVLLFVLFFLQAFLLPAFGEEPAPQVVVDADRVTYDEAGYTALAEGNVRLRYGEFRLQAPHVEMDTRTQMLRASAAPGELVTLNWRGRRLSGERAEFNLVTQEGVVRNASGQVDALLFKGKELEVLPFETAVRTNRISARQARGGDRDGDVAFWEGATITTCTEERPHYRLEATNLVVVPGKRVVAKNPKVYIGEFLLFRYPFDYVVRLDTKQRALQTSFFPSLSYERDRGVGVGFSGPVTWPGGSLTLGLMYWKDSEFEGWGKFEQELSDTVRLFGETEYSYEKESDEKTWRPSWGFRVLSGGWSGTMSWKQREAVEIEKQLGKTYRGTLERDPEFTLVGPWWSDGASGGWWRLHGTWGTYEEEGLRAERRGAGVELYGEGSGTNLVPFWKAKYMHYLYDRESAGGDDTQTVTEAALGFEWPFSNLQMRTTYFRRWVSGGSPMQWDAEEEAEELYQKITIPLGNGWKFAARGGYDLNASELQEIAYWVTYTLDCMEWELLVRDDLRNGDDWAGLRITILAFPDTPLGVGQKEIDDRGSRPKDLPGGSGN
jgi:hypothetical protein